MQIQRHKAIIILFFLVLPVIIAGILTNELLAGEQTNPQNDTQSAALPGQIAPRLQNLGDHRIRHVHSSSSIRG
jgi:hypothetical protein